MTRILKLMLAVVFVQGSLAMATEEPAFEILLETPEYEIRRYQPTLVAEVDVDGSLRSSGSAAFRALADFIFGNNTANEKMKMTAPVESTAVEPTEGVRMKMTAPVTSIESADGERYTYAFVMEDKYSLDSLPEPNNPRIRIVERPARVMAVHRFSGRWTEERYEEHENVLLNALRAAQIKSIGKPVFARYNAPFMPWFLRRNEVMVRIDWQAASKSG